MRISIQKNDPGYAPQHIGCVQVFCSDELVPMAVTADEEDGFVLAHKPDENGKPMLNKTKDGVASIIYDGEVKIYFRGPGRGSFYE